MSTSHEFRAETRKVLNILTHSLYTNREIFLRELLSNASDALDKVRFYQSRGDELLNPELPLEVRITVDKLENALVIADTGIGMNEEEMVENLGTIAHSGSESFLGSLSEEEKSQDATQIVGRFGIGFYSVFMVADKVEVISRSGKGNALATKWTSDGTGSFTVETLDDATLPRGTTIRAYLKKDAEEFLAKYRLDAIIQTHSQFLPFPIFMEDEQVNTSPALWREPKFAITPEQYSAFYETITRDTEGYLDTIHLSVDAPVQFHALLYIPGSTKDYFGEHKDQWGLDLYSRRVLIQHNNQELVPNYLACLKGVVDTEDLPLNISRETLQENVVVRKIGQTIVKQTLSHLERMAQNDAEKYTKFWNLHGKYFKFAFSDYANRDRITPLLRFNSSLGDDLTSLDAYLERAKEGQKDIWYIAASSMAAAKLNPHLERFRRKGVEVLFLLDTIDEFALESLVKYKDLPFKNVEKAEKGDLESFTDTEAAPEMPHLSEEDSASLENLVQHVKVVLGSSVHDVRVSTRLTDSAACLTSPDGVSSSMEKLMRVMQKDESIPKKILELNPDHGLTRAMLRIYKHDANDAMLDEVIHSLLDTTLLLDGYLNDPFAMAERNLKLLEQSSSLYVDLRKLV